MDMQGVGWVLHVYVCVCIMDMQAVGWVLYVYVCVCIMDMQAVGWLRLAQGSSALQPQAPGSAPLRDLT